MNRSLKFNSNLALLHAIRGLAAFYVVVFHARYILWSGGREYLAQFPRETWNILDYLLFSIGMLFTAGSQMVMIFFVLSGFFIAMSIESLKGSLVDKLKIFYSVRFTRIYIPYIASAVLGILVLFLVSKMAPGLEQANLTRSFNNGLAEAQEHETFSNFMYSLLFLKHQQYIGYNFAYWSLLYEAIFYLVVPFVYQYKKAYLVVSAILFVAGMFILNLFWINNILLKFIFEYNFYFAIGQAIYIYREQLSVYAKRNWFKVFSIAGSIILFSCFNVLALMKQLFWSDFLAAVTAGILIIICLNYDLKNNLIVRGVKKLGEMSYSLYLVHIPVLILVYGFYYRLTGATKFFGQNYLIAVLCAVVVSWIFYRIIEKPSLSVIKKIKQLLG